MSASTVPLDRDQVADYEPVDEAGLSRTWLSPYAVPFQIRYSYTPASRESHVLLDYEGDEPAGPPQVIGRAGERAVTAASGKHTRKVMELRFGDISTAPEVADLLRRLAGDEPHAGRRLSCKLVAEILDRHVAPRPQS